MVVSDFEWYGITKFSPTEVVNTGADLATVKLSLMLALQKFRTDHRINRPVLLLQGGMTSGKHRALEHPRGEAADITFRLGETPEHTDLINAAHEAGFKGVGLYHNCVAYSLHLDVGPTYRSWAAFKRHGETEWTYISLYTDPAELATR